MTGFRHDGEELGEWTEGARTVEGGMPTGAGVSRERRTPDLAAGAGEGGRAGTHPKARTEGPGATYAYDIAVVTLNAPVP
ncbi:hypothetical protein [Streptomyces halobius]|uniref:Uncharacterized protein n=1 Tax=Streptomyces halobius TaxID=2879846 RepID=A0ABY4M2I3_9ACTN|nr:hypothetical protein [Streptomyces halobius]UQA91898.1 hypothetical protein K9S39_08555 [Streptomyces halobius]